MSHRLRNRKEKCHCARCHARCEDLQEFQNCEGCNRYFHNSCLLKSKKYTRMTLNNAILFFCSKKCESSVFPFHMIRDKDFVKTNANKILEPCVKCGGECNRFDIIQCDVCDKWSHLVCTSLTYQIINT